ncbi:DUF4403 family protein [Sphingomonas bacterium]|uniref:DUF4403 family protein n=1 Tax=Sphingomonas bacterium TaxID=1895847 RepID=UPI0020C7138B|nr:DUF4403 family protein [Sphingomonas bacterium]
MRRVLCLAVLLAGCSRHSHVPAPPRVDTPARLPAESSTIVVPVTAPLADIEAALDGQLPRVLYSINQHLDQCVPAQRVNLGIAHLKVLPQLGCQIVGAVKRGRVTLSGRGDRLLVTLPITATIAANKVGGLASKTATGAATIHATARLAIAGDWRPTARVTIDYDWTQPPGVEFLGKRIEFASKADARLQPIVARLEQTLPGELSKLRLRQRLAGIWRQAFTVIPLNRDNPPAWMRVTPRRLGVGGYRVAGRTLTLTLAAEALTETFVGPRPPAPAATPLPSPLPVPPERGLRFFVPVIADYHQLEPVVQRALRLRAAKGITLKGVGPVDVRFGRVTVYATAGGRLAIGVDADAKARASSFLTTKGRIWLTALPFNRPNSQAIEARDVQLVADTDSGTVNLLARVFNDSSVRDSVAQGLRHDFAPEYASVLGKAKAAIGGRREGDFLLTADITRVTTGTLAVTGNGLFLPIRAEGKATISYRPG